MTTAGFETALRPIDDGRESAHLFTLATRQIGPFGQFLEPSREWALVCAGCEAEFVFDRDTLTDVRALFLALEHRCPGGRGR